MAVGIFTWWLIWCVIGLIIENDLKAGIVTGTFLTIVWFWILWLLGNYPVPMV